ncbi:hypothetical protein [Paracoccus seriniphilus]|uniref:Glyceraldehyde-3-phosphate dehydrogenase n=1 Tax=Paracoccus seriniphilus TaxID=184748 RepID=A0A239Q1E8_9RHOB|nr:hypothetical protein [Paracoccus seriniphilus]WCR12695.1 hypothetical protein JHW44_06825 [Paracoccus seriniphilus]SNT76073.1 hypothetical protein SAMN05444959_11526 [Paracoccus seriniphilus]
MTNQIAIALGLLILGVFAADMLWFDAGLPVMVGKQLAALIDYVSFWR